MTTLIIELILYFIMAALLKRVTQTSGFAMGLGFALVFTVITFLPGEWIILPLLFSILVFLSATRGGLNLYVAIGLAVVPAAGLAWIMYQDQQAAAANIPADLTKSLSAILRQ